MSPINRAVVFSLAALLMLTGCHSLKKMGKPHRQAYPIARSILGADVGPDYDHLTGIGPYGSPWGYDTQILMRSVAAPQFKWQIRALSQTPGEYQRLINFLQNPSSRQAFVTGMLLSEENPWLDDVSLALRENLCLNQGVSRESAQLLLVHSKQMETPHSGQWIFTVLDIPVRDAVRPYRSLWLFMQVSPKEVPQAISLTPTVSQEFRKMIDQIKGPTSDKPRSDIGKRFFQESCLPVKKGTRSHAEMD